MSIFNFFKNPLKKGINTSVSKTAGQRKGTLSNWITRKLTRYSEKYERELISDRAEDIVANDPNAVSVIDSMSVNIVGTGLIPQSQPIGKALGWDEDQVKEYQEQTEMAFEIFSEDCDARSRLKFWQIQWVAIYNMLMGGEFCTQPVMIDDPRKKFALALQNINPRRLYTPTDLIAEPDIREGIKLGSVGQPESYYIVNSLEANNIFFTSDQDSSKFEKIPAWIAHRPGFIHLFLQKRVEQVRGESILAPAMKAFKDLHDALDFELVGQIVASSFPMFIETANPTDTAKNFKNDSGSDEDENQYQDVNPGQIMYGTGNQKPHVLTSNRPGNNFDSFIERILRMIGSSVGLPYEIVSKDFSKTNFSSARAALLEAFRLFSFYQKWLVDGFCQPIWCLALEEAYLRGMITLPPGSPNWYEFKHIYTRARWIPPKRGHIDIKKEMEGLKIAKDENFMSLADIIASSGDDWRQTMEQRTIERELERTNDIVPPSLVTNNNDNEDMENDLNE